MKDFCRAIDQEFQELLNRNNSRGRSLWVSVRCNLFQFHLVDIHKESDIIHEVYLRAIRYVESGKTINNLAAWCRKTAYNYTRELSRDHKRSQSLVEPNAVSEELEIEWRRVTDEEIDTDITLISEAFKQLTPLDQQILQLFVVEGLPWKDVRQRLAQMNDQERSEAALRKIKERAVKRLRKKFHALQKALSENTDTAA